MIKINNSKYKIYKQVAIQELIPFKLNVKLFKQLIIAKFIFLYFFLKKNINNKYNKVKKRYKYYLKYKSHTKLNSKSFLKYKMNTDNSFYKMKKKKKTDTNLYKLNHSLIYTKKLKYFTKSYLHSKYKLKYVKYRIPKYIYKKKKHHHRYFFPQKTLINFNSLEYLNIDIFSKGYAHLFNFESGSISYFLKYFKQIRYIMHTLTNYQFKNKLNIYFKIINFNKKYSLMKLKLNILIKLLYKLYRYIYLTSLMYKSNNKYKNSLSIGYYFFYIIKKIAQSTSISFINKKKTLNFNLIFSFLNYYNLTYLKIDFKNKIKSVINKQLPLLEINKYNIFWSYFINFFFLRKLKSQQLISTQDFKIKFYLFPILLYKKYISLYFKANMFYSFFENIATYKQSKQLKKYFIKLYRQKYRKQHHNTYHNELSFYNTQRSIIAILNSKPDRNHAYEFNYTRIKLFQRKVFKILYNFKQTRKYMKIINKLSKKFKTPNQSFNFNNGIINLINNFINGSDVKANEFIKSINVNNKSYSIDKYLNSLNPFKIGDVLKFKQNNSNYFYNYKNFLNSFHFYLILFYLFKFKKINKIQTFGYFTFFLDILLYKFSYILIYHIYKNNLFKKKLTRYHLNHKLIINNVLNNKLYYINLKSKINIFNHHPIYVDEPYNLEAANLDQFYKYKFKKKHEYVPTNRFLNFLNFFMDLSYNTQMIHNHFHLIRFLNFLKTLKKNILSFIQYDFLYNKKSILITTNSSMSFSAFITNYYEFSNSLQSIMYGANNYEIFNKNEYFSYKSLI